MWKDLGLNLEKHDVLLNALAKGYGDLFMTQKNRPAGMGYFDFVISEVHGSGSRACGRPQEGGQEDHRGVLPIRSRGARLRRRRHNGRALRKRHFPYRTQRPCCPGTSARWSSLFFGFKVGATCPYFNSCDMVWVRRPATQEEGLRGPGGLHAYLRDGRPPTRWTRSSPR